MSSPRKDLERGRAQLDRARGQLVVLRPDQSGRHVTRDVDDEFTTDAAGRLVGIWRIRLVDDDLGDPVAISDVQEDQLPVIAPPMDPPGKAGAGARVGRAQLAAGVRAVGRGKARGRGRHGGRIVAVPSDLTVRRRRPV